MTSNKGIRIYIDTKLTLSARCEISADKSHYLYNVMRCKEGDVINCFNGYDGEFSAKILKIDKKKTVVELQKQTKTPEIPSDLWLLFAPLKKDNTDFVIEKTTELGVKRIIPVVTQYTNSNKIKKDRFVNQAIEASEQCERLSIPEIADIIKLKDLLNNWDNNRTLFFMNERRGSQKIIDAFCKEKNKSVAILVGPEGGFSDEEAKYIENLSFVRSISMGPRILRAETAVVSALSVWQACVGDWR